MLANWFRFNAKRFFCTFLSSSLRQYVASFLLGGVMVFAFAPFDLSFLVIPCLACLFLFWFQARTAFIATVNGFAFGLGFFGLGVSWVSHSIVNFGGVSEAIAFLITALGVAYLAAFIALAGLLTHLLAKGSLFAASFFWCVSEWLRGSFLTGFPWLSVGYSQILPHSINYPAWVAPVLGVYGVSLVVAFTASCFAYCMLDIKRRCMPAGLLILATFIPIHPFLWTAPTANSLSVSLIQGNVPIEMKWNANRNQTIVEHYRELVKKTTGDFTIFPETALPIVYDNSFMPLSLMGFKEGTLFGTIVKDEHRFYNSAVLFDQAIYRYDKRHLVPFGEYVPSLFRFFVDALRIPMSDLTQGDNTQPMLSFRENRLLVTICYEDIFGGEIAKRSDDANIIINISELAWFGHSFAIAQHGQMAQMRSLELGKPTLRSGNVGLTAHIDAQGRLMSELPLHTTGVLNLIIQPYQGNTPFGRYGNSLLLSLLVVLGIVLYVFYWYITKTRKSVFCGK